MLRERDWFALLRFVEELAVTRTFPEALREVALALARLIPCEAAGYGEASAGGYRIEQFPAALGYRQEELAFLAANLHELPYIDLAAAGRQALSSQARAAQRSSDHFSQRQLRQLATFHEVFRPRDFHYTMVLPTLQLAHGWTGGFGMHRAGRDFSDREALLLTLARPHLVRALERGAERDRAELAAAQRSTLRQVATRRAAPLVGPLTSRETEVLRWVGDGKTNREIAQLLGVSVNTVRNHVARILQKLGVENRTGAARALHPL